MSIQELVEQIDQLPAEDQRKILKLLKRRFPDIAAEEDEEVDIRAEFRQAWREAMEGKTHPISTLWDDIDEE